MIFTMRQVPTTASSTCGLPTKQMFATSKSLHIKRLYIMFQFSVTKKTDQYILKMYIKMNNDTMDDWW